MQTAKFCLIYLNTAHNKTAANININKPKSLVVNPSF